MGLYTIRIMPQQEAIDSILLSDPTTPYLERECTFPINSRGLSDCRVSNKQIYPDR